MRRSARGLFRLSLLRSTDKLLADIMSRRLFIITATILISRSLLHAQSASPAGQAVGRLSVTVTFGTNTLLTRRPDERAWVLLFPSDYHSTQKIDTPRDIEREREETTDPTRAPKFGEADGDGKVLLTGLAAGRYQLVVISKHTLAGPNLRAASKEVLRRYFTDSLIQLISQLKVDLADVEITASETTDKHFHFED